MGSTRLPRRVVRFGWALAALAVVAWIGTSEPRGVAFAGDPALAKFLLKGGKDDLAKKELDQAFTKFERAEREDPTLLEAVYCQALTLDRKGDARTAAQTYRRYLLAMGARGADAETSKADAALVKKARERLEALDAGTAEHRRLDAAFVEGILAFARANLVKDPAIAAEALRSLLAVHPDHAEAKKLLEKLPSAPQAEPAKPEEKPEGEPLADFASIRNWADLLGGQYFGAKAGWRYEKDLLRIEHDSERTVERSPKGNNTGASYAVEMEGRLLDTFHSDGLVGFAFGIRGGDGYSFVLTEGAAVLNRIQNGQRTDLTRFDIVPGGTGVWHRLGVIVRGRQIELWLDGTKRGEHLVVQRENVTGELGIFQQYSNAEIRLIRIAENAQ